MTKEDMLHYIDKSLSFYPSLKCLVLTGGEVSCYKQEELTHVMTYAHDKGFSNVRIVSNGVWASTDEKAHKYINELAHGGLNELNLSTGDEHSMFVPLSNICHAIKSAKDAGIYVSIALEKHYKNAVTEEKIKEEYAQIYKEPLTDVNIIASDWIELKHLKKTFSPNDFNGQQEMNVGCVNLFCGLQINPNGQLLSCCGFAAEFSEYLKLGHIDSYNSREEYENNLYNILNMWLYTDGPKGIIEYLEGKNLNNDVAKHPCEYCLKMLMNKDYINKIQHVGLNKVKEIILRYEVRMASQT